VGTYRLETLFNPHSVAVVGASDRADSVGGVVFRKLIEGGFKGLITPINPKYTTVNGVKCFPTLTKTGHVPDLVIIAVPAEAVPDLIAEAAALGCKVAIILTAGLGRGKGSLSETILQTARAAGLRLVGPNCLGVLSPTTNLNASFSTLLPPKGSLALISQSGAIAAGMVAWAQKNGIGFSNVVSLGEAIDIDIADCLDYCAEDKATRAILLYVESIQDTRKFMSAARRAARVKPVIVLKAGRHAEGAKAAATHTGALAGSDAVYDAAFQRAGCSRVMDLRELFQAAEVFSTQDAFTGDKIAILTNGGGLGVLAVDRLMDLGGNLAQLSPKTIDALDAVLPKTWSRSNPVDIIGDATAERYAKALACLLDDKGCDIILVMNCPTAISSSNDAAEAIINIIKTTRNKKGRRVPIFACWLSMQAEQQKQFREAQIIPFDTEAEAAEGIMLLVKDHRQRQRLRLEIPASHKAIMPDRLTAENVIRTVVADRRTWLSPIEVSQLLTAYGITATPVVEVATPEAASEASKQFLATGGACVVKLLSRDITHKSDVDGVRLNLASASAVRSATLDITERAKKLRPEARIDGVTVQPMIVRPKARELIAGIAVDPTFGPIILFGHGGTAVELINDKALSLLPINITQAHELIERTHISRLLKGYRNVPAADTPAVAETLVRLSRMVEDIPEIVGVDLNPLLADETGVLAVDARIEINPVMAGQTTKALRTRFSIRPYPRELEHNIHLQSGLELFIRPLRPDDEGMLTEMMKHVTPDDIRMRFFNPRKTMDRAMIARLTQLDYARDMALVAMDKTNQTILGVARLMGDANQQAGEYAILVRSDHQFEGIGTKLMQHLLSFAADEGYSRIHGQVLSDNQKMLNLCKILGFTLKQSAEAGIIISELNLPNQKHEGAGTKWSPLLV
jgi:acetyltransferase